jgi:hypothetical protein
MRKNYTMPSAGHGRSALYAVRSFDVRLARIERVVNSLHKKLEDFRIALEQLVPHLGALEAELHLLSVLVGGSRSRLNHLTLRR